MCELLLLEDKELLEDNFFRIIILKRFRIITRRYFF